LRNFTDKTLEGKLPDKELSRLLVATNFTKSDGSRAETMRLLHTAGGLQQHKSDQELTDKDQQHPQQFSAPLMILQRVVYGALCLNEWKVVSDEDQVEHNTRYSPPVDLRAVCLVRAIEI
jgi:hypothetical protein